MAGLVTFTLLLVLQVLVWRVRRPAGQYGALTVLSVVVPCLSLAGSWALQGRLAIAAVLPQGAFDYLNAGVLYVALVLAWVTTYSAVQADSPTMTMLLRIEATERRGITATELLADLGDEVLVLPRLVDLVRGGLVTLERERYVIGRRGALMARAHLGFRALLKMEKGG